MIKKIRISSNHIGSVEARLLEDKNPLTVKALWEGLPYTSQAKTWGDEVYFSIPIKLEEEDAQYTVKIGDLAYWPLGEAFCIFFGTTPMSSGTEIKPASPVNVFGKIEGDPKIFKKIENGDSIKVERYKKNERIQFSD